MVVRGRLAFDDQGRLVEIAEDAADPTNPEPSEIEPVEFKDIVSGTMAVGSRTVTDLGLSVSLGGTNQFISPATWETVAFDTESVDDFGEWDTANYTFTPHTAGTYLFQATVEYTNLATPPNDVFIRLMKNGSEINRIYNSASKLTHGFSLVVVAFGATSSDSFHFETLHTADSDAELQGAVTKTHAQIVQLG